VRLFSSTGEASNRPDYLWLMATTGYRAPVIEYCGGTEIGGGYITGTVLQPASPATITLPALGLDLVLLDEAGQPVDGPEKGEVFLVPPSIGLSETLLNPDHDTVYSTGAHRARATPCSAGTAISSRAWPAGSIAPRGAATTP
jgi:acetyl-CoA synthetase